MAVTVEAITDADVDRVARFLHAQLNPRVPASSWSRSLRTDNGVAAPNRGFMLVKGDEVVGAYAAQYSARLAADGPVTVCNLGAWCVLAAERFHSVRLLKALLDQPGMEFLDLSPSGNTLALNARLGFRHLDTTTDLVPALPWVWGGVSGSPAVLERTLTGGELVRYHDHRDREAARHVVLTDGARSCYVVYRMDRRKDLPRVFATILHVSDAAVFHRMVRRLGGYLLVRHGAAAILAERRVVGGRCAASFPVSAPRPKMFRGDRLPPDDIDYLYSELVSLSW